MQCIAKINSSVPNFYGWENNGVFLTLWSNDNNGSLNWTINPFKKNNISSSDVYDGCVIAMEGP